MIEKFNNNNIFFIVPEVARTKHKLKGSELMIFSLIFSNNGIEMSEIPFKTGLSFQTIIKAIGFLAVKDLIEKKDGLFFYKEKKDNNNK